MSDRAGTANSTVASNAGNTGAMPRPVRSVQNHIPADRGMTGFRDYLRQNVSQDAALLVDRVMSMWSRIHGNRVVENPTKNHVALLRTYRAMAVLGTDGRLRTAEVVRLEDFNLFATNEAERELVLSETKWNDGGQFLVAIPGVGTSSLSHGTWLDSDGSNMRARCYHAMRAMTLMLNVEFRLGDCPAFLDSGEDIAGTTAGRLRRMTPETALQFQRAWEADIACYMEAKKKFMSFLDQDILHVMTNAKIKAVSGYNWLRGTDVLPEHSASISRARVWLVDAFPLMHAAFRDNSDLNVQDLVEKIAEDIRLGVISNENQMMAMTDEHGRQMIYSVLADYYNAIPGQVKNFRGVRPDDIGVEDTLPPASIRSLIKTAPTFPPYNEQEPELRRNIIRASFLASAFEMEISKFAMGVSLLPPVALLDESRVKEAIRVVGDVAAWLTTMVKIPVEALRGQNGSRLSMPNVLALILGNTPLDQAADRIISINRVGQRFIDTMQTHYTPRPADGRVPVYSMAREPLEWASMFRQATQYLAAGRIRVLTTERDVARLAQMMRVLLPSAAGRAFSGITNYVELADQDGELAGMIAVNPEVLRNSASFESNNDEARWILRKWTVEGKEDVVAGCINNIRQIVSDDPDVINLRYLRAERNERMALLGETMQCSTSEHDSAMQLLLYNNGIDWLAPNALPGMLRQIEEYMPDNMRCSSRDEFLVGANRHENEVRRASESYAQERQAEMEQMTSDGDEDDIMEGSVSSRVRGRNGEDDFDQDDDEGIDCSLQDDDEGIDCNLSDDWHQTASSDDDLTIAVKPDEGTPRRAMLEALHRAEVEKGETPADSAPRPSSPSPF